MLLSLNYYQKAAIVCSVFTGLEDHFPGLNWVVCSKVMCNCVIVNKRLKSYIIKILFNVVFSPGVAMALTYLNFVSLLHPLF